MSLIEGVREKHVAFFLSTSKSEYLLAYQYEGDSKNAFACFEIGYIVDDKTLKTQTSTHLSENHFQTESGLKLGLSKDSLVMLKGDKYILLEKDSIVRYSLDMSSEFVKRYNSPGYFIEAKIRDNRIIRLKYGFEYP